MSSWKNSLDFYLDEDPVENDNVTPPIENNSVAPPTENDNVTLPTGNKNVGQVVDGGEKEANVS